MSGREREIMEGLRRGFVWFMIVSCAMGREPVLHRVGGGKWGWKPNVNFTNWTIHERFYVGDWLYFGFDKKMCNVLEVNKRGYDKCVESKFIKNITQGGRDVFNLTQPKPYYFLSGRGFCFHGMKLAVYVQDFPSPSLPITHSGSTIIRGWMILFSVLAFNCFVMVINVL